MKNIIISIVLILILISGCGSSNSNVVEGETEQEIEACQLIKEFGIQGGTISDFSDIKCEFITENTSEKSIMVYVRHKDDQDKDYKNYENFVSVIPEEKILLMITPRSNEKGRAFIKDGNKFKEIEVEKALDYIK
ncbi:MAG: hypothetical protein ABIH78_04990 [Candidatus Peregrinibacteria bacterium]